MGPNWATIVAAISGLVGSVLTWAVGRYTARSAASATMLTKVLDAELTRRRDTIADRDTLLDRYDERLQTLDERLHAMESRIHAMSRHVDVLRHHIWERLPPPPPPPPEPY